ncbi:MAG: HlyC/CorC family transporter [Clostridia bacterium]|nr:HlyC/CorC family transporter [Clostridia bacterium]
MFSAYFSSVESALSSMNKIRIKSYADDGDKRAKRALRLEANYDRTITALLIGNNVVNIACASLATVLVVNIFSLLKTNISEGAVTAITTVVTTVVIFLAGEMFPKSYARAHSDEYIMKMSGSLSFLVTVLTPVAFLFQSFSRLIQKLVKSKEEPTVTEEELTDIIETIEEEGVIDEDQGDLLQSALVFSKKKVADVLTLREDVVGIERSMDQDEILAIIRNNKYSRLPVYRRDMDHILGFLSARAYLKAVASGKEFNLASLISKPYYVSYEAEIDDELAKMSKNKTSIAIVRGKKNEILGIVTVEDFLEELVGEIFDEDDVVNHEFMKLGGNYFDVAPTLFLADAFRRMKYTPPVTVPARLTVGVFVAEKLGHTPEEGDTFRFHDVLVCVKEVEDGRLNKVTFHIETARLATKKRDASAEEVTEE